MEITDMLRVVVFAELPCKKTEDEQERGRMHLW